MDNNISILKNSLATKFPELLSEWDFEKNSVSPHDVSYGSGHRAHWKCIKCGSIWDLCIRDRTSKRGSNCPYCSPTHKRVNENNCLATLNPELAKQWHQTKNGEITPEKVTARTSKTFWWLCPSCGYEWRAPLNNRNSKDNKINRGCPACSGNVVTDRNCIATVRPELINRWHPTKNGELTPYNVSYKSEKVIHFICENNPEHEWAANAGYVNNCRFCTGRLLSKEKSIAITHPEIAKDWHPSLNKALTPYDVTKGMVKKAWWKCSVCGHEWNVSIGNRIKGSCPKCSQKSTSFAQESMFYYVSKIFPNAINRYKIDGKEVDIFIPELNIAIEYDSTLHNKKAIIRRDKEKNVLLHDKSIPFFRIRDEGCVDLEDDRFILIERKKPLNKATLSTAIIELLNKIKTLNDSEAQSIEEVLKTVDTSKDGAKIMEEYIVSVKKNSIINTHPHLVDEWDYDKNGNLSPDMFSSGSNHPIHWKCEKGHRWVTKITMRTNQNTRCPICFGPNANEFDNLEVKNPEIAKWWHPTKNENLKPTMFKSKSPKKVWWKCPHCGGEFDRVVNSQVNCKTKCQICKTTEI